MQLSQAQAKIRPRSPWEAIDLGFVMAREWFLELWLAWLMLALPLWVIAHLVFHDILWLASTLVWWFKPLYEQPLLYIVSRRLFGESVSRGQLARRLFKIVLPQLFANLTWRRLSPNRSFNNPVTMLEGLRGKARKQRLVLLHRQQRISGWLTILAAHIEAILNISFIVIVMLLIPENLDWLDIDDFYTVNSDQYQLATWFSNIGYFLAISIMAPFYVAAGFSLYIYTRVKLEAWEIEVAFRAIKNRLDSSKTLISGFLLPLFIIGFLLLPGGDALAQTQTNINTGADNVPINPVSHTADSSRQLISEILEDEAFGETRMITRWRLKKTAEEESQDEFPEWLLRFLEWLLNNAEHDDESSPLTLALVFEILFWIAGAIVLLLLLRLLWPALKDLRWATVNKSVAKSDTAPQVSFLSEKLALHELPEDILSEVQTLYAQQRYRAAISLLYRGALKSLIDLHQLDIPQSATENDCLELVTQARPDEESGYFKRLTRAWLSTAYAHQSPPKEQIEKLVSQWPRYFGGAS